MNKSRFSQYLAFERMIAPTVVEVLFWIGLARLLISGIVEIVSAPGPRHGLVIGVALIIVGPFMWRLICEYMIIVFRMHACLEWIAKHTDRESSVQ